MKNRVFILAALVAVCVSLQAQVWTKPAFIEKGYKGEFSVIYNANEGNEGMKTATACYAHTGVIINGETWKHATASWRDNTRPLTKNEDGYWELKITPDVGSFYGCTAAEEVEGLCFVFNDGKNGSLEGKTFSGGDIFYYFRERGTVEAAILTPSQNRLLGEKEEITIICGSSEEGELSLSINGEEVATATGQEIKYRQLFDGDSYHIVFTAKIGEHTLTDERTITMMTPSPEKTRPEGIDMGIYYNEDDYTRVTLSTYAASKTAPAQAVYVLGDFNDWTPSSHSLMNRDGNYFWIELTDLEPQKEYAYQYFVVRADGVTKTISDLYATKLLHPDDKYEPKTVDPTLMDYPAKGAGYVSVLQTNKPKFEWSDETLNFKRPDKNNLIIYEVWVYDYTVERSILGLMNRLDYIQNLGVNAIELMPICEFDGNYNWGYSPNHYFAPDRAYGSETQIKTFIDECHKRGIAVIMDMVFNHATGLNPMNMLYPYGDDLKNNPWFCTEVPHDDNVYEHWNHDFEPARQMFTRALNYWITEYKVDGYRMDLSHGLCGCGTKATYDYSKLMNNLSHYYTEGVQAAAEDAYFILEHWGPNMTSQRPTLVAQGMLCWQNTNNAYSQLAMGYLTQDNLTDANKDGYVSYCESHDEERNYYKAKTWGVGYIKDNQEYRLSRVPLTIAFNVLLNGPHMIWQYNELGFDYSINSERGKSDISSDYRCNKKARPDNLGWFDEGIRMDQYQKVAQLVQLRTRLLPELFAGDPKSSQLSGGKPVRNVLWENEDDAVYVVGNFSPEEMQSVRIPNGTWYDYLNGGRALRSLQVVLLPGEVRVFTSRSIEPPIVPASYSVTTDIDPRIDIDVTDDRVDAVPWLQVEKGEWTVYPAYTTDRVMLSAAADVEVYNLNGQLVQRVENTTEVRLGGQQSGMYLLRLNRNGEQHTAKVIKR